MMSSQVAWSGNLSKLFCFFFSDTHSFLSALNLSLGQTIKKCSESLHQTFKYTQQHKYKLWM
jgi:hypothetical protein